jgi:hypothetical protein
MRALLNIDRPVGYTRSAPYFPAIPSFSISLLMSQTTADSPMFVDFDFCDLADARRLE